MSTLLLLVFILYVAMIAALVMSSEFDARLLSRLPGATERDSRLGYVKTEKGRAYAVGALAAASLGAGLLLQFCV